MIDKLKKSNILAQTKQKMYSNIGKQISIILNKSYF